MPRAGREVVVKGAELEGREQWRGEDWSSSKACLQRSRFQRNERCGFYFRLRKSPQQNEGGFYLHTMLSRDQVARVLLGLGYAARPDPEDTLPERHGGAPRLNDPPGAQRSKQKEAPLGTGLSCNMENFR